MVFFSTMVGICVVEMSCRWMLLCILLRRHRSSTRVFFLMIRRPPRSTLDRSSAASDVYKRQNWKGVANKTLAKYYRIVSYDTNSIPLGIIKDYYLSLINISEPTRPY